MMTSQNIFTALCLVLAWTITAPAAAKTDWQSNRLVPLSKITVGPWDNFEATVRGDDHIIYYTRSVNQIPAIYSHDLAANESRVVIGKQGDAKDPVIGPGGGRLAVTFYGKDALGDVCLYELARDEIQCLTGADSVDESPFWIDDTHVGFLSRPTSELDWRLIEYDLGSHAQRVLHEGLLSGPVASPDARYVLFNQATPSGQVDLRVYDRQKQALISPVRFDLPGITGFMAFSADSRFLYFNHYLSDTNRDHIIDANDHSVTFRVPFAAWLSAKEPMLPEQLTSVANNCKFPATTPRHLYITCAYEGSLDVYRLPLSGSVPAHWNQAQLWEAHRAARTYEARLLLLNTLRYRSQLNDLAMLERLLSNHLEIGELTAANYYVAQLLRRYREKGNDTMAVFYQSLGRLLETRAAKQQVPVGLVTARLHTLVQETRSQIQQDQGWSRLIEIMNAWLDYELENNDRALERLRHVDLARTMLPMERYLAFELYRRLLSQTEPGRLLADYPLMFDADNLSRQSRLYYAFEYLKLLARVQSDPSRRMATITSQVDLTRHADVADVLRGEVATLRLAAAQDPKTQGVRYQELSALLKSHQKNPLVRQVLHTRAIQILGAANQFKYMELLSRHWLTTTHISEIEFFTVAEQYSLVTMDKAYGMMAEGDLARAYVTFYSAIRQTNDLEAHYQFVTLGLDPALNKKDNLERSYAVLEEQGLLGQNAKYVEALRLLIESGEEPSNLEKAIPLLDAMEVQGLSPAMRDLLLGYVYHRRLRIGQAGYRYDKKLFQRAHHHYMMAFDLARDNGRILATAWENLASLHFEVRNYALSAAYYAQRMTLPFVTLEQEAATRWGFARALFYNNDRDSAKEQALAALALARQSDDLDETPFIEKAAFYAMQAGDHQQARSHYQRLLDQDTLPAENRAKALLGFGFALSRSNHRDAARERLQQAADLSEKLQAEPASNTRLLAFRPARLQLIAFGMLAGLSETAEQAIDYRRQRIAILQSMAGNVEEFAYEETGRLSFLAKDYQHIAAAQERLGAYGDMAQAMDKALEAAVAWSKETEDPVGPVIYRTLVNYLSLGISHPQAFTGPSGQVLQQACEQAIAAFEQLPFQSPALLTRQGQLRILWQGYQAKQSGDSPGALAQRLAQILQRPALAGLKAQAPEAYRELQRLADGVTG